MIATTCTHVADVAVEVRGEVLCFDCARARLGSLTRLARSLRRAKRRRQVHA